MAVFDIDRCWAALFPEGELRDLNFCDLFTQLWLRRRVPLPKTELYDLMPNISRRTAVKYVQTSIDAGMLEEVISVADRRVHLVSLSAACEARVERFLDFTCQRFRGVGASRTGAPSA